MVVVHIMVLLAVLGLVEHQVDLEETLVELDIGNQELLTMLVEVVELAVLVNLLDLMELLVMVELV